MPQGRILLKAISDSKKLASLKTDGARLLYSWLIPHVDLNGNFSADPDVINGQVLTRLKKDRRTVQLYLEDLENVGLIVRYETNGDIFLHLPTFVERQPHLRPEKEGKPTIPVPTAEQLRRNSAEGPTQVKQSKVKQSKVKESEVKREGNNSAAIPATTTSPPLSQKTKETKTHKSNSADRIIAAWQKLPLPDEKKQFAPADVLAIERAISILAGDSQEPIHEGMILEAIENYKKALSLSDSQTYKHKLHPWLMEHIRKYVSYNFDIEHHRKSNFERKGKTSDDALAQLKAEGRIP